MSKQFGGEGQEKYKGKKDDKDLKQHGGEGGSLAKKSDTSLLKPDASYGGPGRTLKREK